MKLQHSKDNYDNLLLVGSDQYRSFSKWWESIFYSVLLGLHSDRSCKHKRIEQEFSDDSRSDS